MATLELDMVEAFVLTADLRSFTRAAEALGCTQPVISGKIRRLEEELGRRLLDRTPRLVRLTSEGETFLGRARVLLAAHRNAAACFDDGPGRLRVGFSHHIVERDLPLLIGQVTRAEPSLILEVQVGSSRDLLAAFERAELDAAVVLSADRSADDATFIGDEAFGWFGSGDYRWSDQQPLHLVAQAKPCSIREMAIAALEEAQIPWREVFVGGGPQTVTAAVAAGLGVAAVGRRLAGQGLLDLSGTLRLPALPARALLLYSRVTDARGQRALQTLAAALRGKSHASHDPLPTDGKITRLDRHRHG